MTYLRQRNPLLSLTLSTLILIGLSACNAPDGKLTSNVNGNGSDVVTTPQPTPSPTDVSGLYKGPAELAKYVQKFVDDAKIQGVDVVPDMSGLEIRIASLSAWGSSTIGLCETGGGLKRVTFSPSFWNSVSETQRELLAHHELGHCVLYRAHRSSTLSSGAYASIMYPIIMSSSTYTSDYDYYQQELFTWASSSAVTANTVTANENGVVTHVCDQDE